MKSSFAIALIQVLLGSPLLATAAALPDTLSEHASQVNQTVQRDCRVNSAQRDEWVENGMTRWRTVFSTVNINPETYCKYWPRNCGNEPQRNYQCGWDGAVDGGTWRIDASFNRGPAGDAEYWNCLGRTRSLWVKDTDCLTG